MWTPSRRNQRQQSEADRIAERREQDYRSYKHLRSRGFSAGTVLNSKSIDVDDAFKFEVRFLREIGESRAQALNASLFAQAE